MAKKISIGLFIDSYFPMIDGVTLVVHNYALALSKVADVTVFCPQLKDDFDDSTLPYKVIRMTKTVPLPLTDYRTPLPKIDPKFIKALNECKLDIVHIHSGFGIGKQGVKYAERHNIPSVATMHTQHKRDLYERTKMMWFANMIIKRVCALMNRVTHRFAVNQKTADLWHEYGLDGVPGVLPNATDLVYINDDKVVNELKKKYSIKDEAVFIYCGRIDKTKNIDFTLEVLKKLKEKGLKFKMIFIGDGNYLAHFAEHATELGLEDECIFTGKIYDRILLANYYKLADLQLFPSDYDTCSLVKIEAASQKTPTILAKDSFAASSIVDEVNGYVEKLDVDAFANKILSIISDKEKLKLVGQNAYEQVYVHWDELINQVYNMYLKFIIEFPNKQDK